MNYEDEIIEYIECLSSSYPGLANIWAIRNEGLGSYNRQSIAEFTNYLEKIKQSMMRNSDNKVDSEIELLIKSINMRIFEMTELNDYQNKCSFYVEKIFVTLLETFDISDNVDEQKEVFLKRLLHFERCCIEAVEILKKGKISRIEVINAIKEGELICSQIERKGKGLLNESYYKNKEYFFSSLLEIKKSVKANFIPYERDIFEQLIWHSVGIKININKLYEESDVFFQKISIESNSVLPKIECNTHIIYENIHYIYNNLSSKFGEIDNFINSFSVTPNLEDVPFYFSPIKTAAYNRKKFADRDVAEFIYNANGIHSKAELQGKIIHEIYPGHHYLNTIYAECDDLILDLCDEPFFEEGWAKFCEYKCASLLNDINLNKYVKHNLTEMITVGQTVVKIHYFHHEIEDIIKWLIIDRNKTEKEAKNILLTAYLEPMDKMPYYVGFFLFLQILGDESISDLNNILKKSRKSFGKLEHITREINKKIEK